MTALPYKEIEDLLLQSEVNDLVSEASTMLLRQHMVKLIAMRFGQHKAAQAAALFSRETARDEWKERAEGLSAKLDGLATEYREAHREASMALRAELDAALARANAAETSLTQLADEGDFVARFRLEEAQRERDEARTDRENLQDERDSLQQVINEAQYPTNDDLARYRERAEKLNTQLANVVAAMAPLGSEFLDPPDGGSVEIHEQVERVVTKLLQVKASFVSLTVSTSRIEKQETAVTKKKKPKAKRKAKPSPRQRARTDVGPRLKLAPFPKARSMSMHDPDTYNPGPPAIAIAEQDGPEPDEGFTMIETPTPIAEKLTCYFCRAPVTNDEKCHGCDEHVCDDCDIDEPIGKHEVDAHRESATAEDERDLQQREVR